VTNATQPITLLGIDSCKGGWVVAAVKSENLSSMQLHVVPSILEALSIGGPGAVVAVDMPIGLLDTYQEGGRECDRLTRKMLSPRGSCVFPTPVRPAIEATTYPEACNASRSSTPGAGALSKQSFSLAPKIREIDTLLRAVPELRSRVVETHPEVVFMVLADEPLPPKKQDDGKVRRIALLATQGISDPTSVPPDGRNSGYRADDLIDAAACLLVARAVARGVAVSIPVKPPRDRFGIPMQIVTPGAS